MLRIDPTNYEVAVHRAEATLKQRQIEYDGAEKLRSQGYRAESEYASAAAALAAAEADLVNARRNLERTRISLPYAGMVRSKEADLGQYVNPGTRLGVTFATDYAEVRLPLTDSDLGFIDLLFPDSRVIHCRRNPMDTCLSCYFQDFEGHHPYVTDLESLGQFYLQYHRLMKHWKKHLKINILDIDYEMLVDDFEATCKKIIAFCGLDWNDACLDFYKHERLVITASVDQVNKPLYSSSVERWRNYEEYIGPLKAALADIKHTGN